MWAKHIHDGLAALLHNGGFSALSDAVGSAHTDDTSGAVR